MSVANRVVAFYNQRGTAEQHITEGKYALKWARLAADTGCRHIAVNVWHLADLDEEFTTDSEVADFEQYLQLEDRLFRQLDEKVYAESETGPEHRLDRYSAGSAAARLNTGLIGSVKSNSWLMSSVM